MSERDWTEDFAQENGNYTNLCRECRQYFLGHKRRIACKACTPAKAQGRAGSAVVRREGGDEITVAELIEVLQSYPQDLPVAYALFSEHALLEPSQIRVEELCFPRADGWVANKRPDKESRLYLVFPGN